MGKPISKNGPWSGNEFTEFWWNRELILNRSKHAIKATNGRKYVEYGQKQKHHYVDDNQLHVAVIGFLKCVFKFF